MHHHLTEELQRKNGYSYTIGPYHEPVLEIDPGDSVSVETMDCFECRLDSEALRVSDVTREPFLNPVNGPIYVKGARPGDALAVRIESIAPRGPQPCGTTCLRSFMGGLASPYDALATPYPEFTRRLVVTGDGVVWNDRLTLPYRPFIGTIATAHPIFSVDTLAPGRHGGNMDLPDVCPGATLYLPVRAEGALLFLGDCHALQGDGELAGAAVEFPTTTDLRIDVVRDWPIEWPLLENDRFIMATGSEKPLEEAVKVAYNNLIAWMVDKYGFNKWDAYFLVTQMGTVRVANIVDPVFTAGAGIEKRYLVPSDDIDYDTLAKTR